MLSMTSLSFLHPANFSAVVRSMVLCGLDVNMLQTFLNMHTQKKQSLITQSSLSFQSGCVSLGKSDSNCIQMHHLIEKVNLCSKLRASAGWQAASDFQFPKIAVIGPQSSGKTSVLEVSNQFLYKLNRPFCEMSL